MSPMTVRRSFSTLLLAVIGTVAITSCAGAPAIQDHFPDAVSADGLARLRACESGGNYGAVSSSGSYRGAYQFSRSTWNNVARSYYPELNGVDPAGAAPWDQDRMARALWATAGRGQWPVCGRRV